VVRPRIDIDPEDRSTHVLDAEVEGQQEGAWRLLSSGSKETPKLPGDAGWHEHLTGRAVPAVDAVTGEPATAGGWSSWFCWAGFWSAGFWSAGFSWPVESSAVVA